MNALLSAVFALSLAAPSFVVGDSLQVVTADATLGEEIARAARRYLRGAVQVRGASDAATDSTHPEREAALTVRRAPTGGGQRWLLVLSAGGNRTIRRTIELHEIPTRFDLAEAVAIGLPDMLARLAEQQTPPLRAIPALSAATSTPRPLVAMTARVPQVAHVVPAEPQPPPLRPAEVPIEKSEAAPPASAPAPESPPAAPPDSAKKEANQEFLKEEKKESQKEPIPLVAPKLPSPSLNPQTATENPQARVPAAAIGLTASGVIVLLAGIGTGAAAQQAARQVDQPIEMRFDQNLDQRGKALNTATIVLDAVGGAAILSGGAWILTRMIKARRAAPKLSLLPSGAGLVLKGSF